MTEIKNILEFIHLAEKLKSELRHNWLSCGRQESVAEHTWRVALMAIAIHPYLETRVELSRALKIAIVHDLCEAEAYDIPAFETNRQKEKEKVELQAMQKVKQVLNSQNGEEIFNLWKEYEDQKTLEAKFVKALDKMEVRIQHNESSLEKWNEIEYPRSLFAADKFCQFDEFIKNFNELIKEESRQKIKVSGKELQVIEQAAEKQKNKKD